LSTPETLEGLLDEDRAWRRTELHSLLSQIREALGPAQRCLCRAGIALLYAHWEGYTKRALSQYLKYVARRRLLVSELSLCFIARALDNSMKKQTGTSNLIISVERVKWLIGNESNRPFIPSNDGVDTRNNLNFGVCTELFASLGLDIQPLETKKMLIDYRLLRQRNQIAHGEYVDISAVDYAELHHEVLDMMESVQRSVMNAVDNQHYRRSAVVFQGEI
jgi:hypothetical protein